MFFRDYGKNAELAETRVLLQKYSVFWGSSGSKWRKHVKRTLKIDAWKAFGKYMAFGAEMDPKRDTWNVQRRTFFETFLHVIFDMFLRSFLDRKLVQNGSKKGSKMWWKIIKNGFPRQGAILERFWLDFWVILVQFGFDLGLILERFWYDFSTHFRPRKTAANSTNSLELPGNHRK